MRATVAARARYLNGAEVKSRLLRGDFDMTAEVDAAQ
jgi:hypothetical protein